MTGAADRLVVLGLILAVITLPACNISSSPSISREKLTREELLASESADAGPVLNEYFLPTTDVSDALHVFSGRLEIPETSMHTRPAAIQPSAIGGKATQLFPAVSVRFVSHDGHLIPVERGIIYSPDNDSFWQIQISPGRVWSEAGDVGMSRASFPFLLTSNIENESYNGVATFLYDDEQVSYLRYQVVQQLTPYLVETRFVASGHVAAAYSPADIASRGSIIENFAASLDPRVPSNQ